MFFYRCITTLQFYFLMNSFKIMTQLLKPKCELLCCLFLYLFLNVCDMLIVLEWVGSFNHLFHLFFELHCDIKGFGWIQFALEDLSLNELLWIESGCSVSAWSYSFKFLGCIQVLGKWGLRFLRSKTLDVWDFVAIKKFPVHHFILFTVYSIILFAS